MDRFIAWHNGRRMLAAIEKRDVMATRERGRNQMTADKSRSPENQ
jgi:hypothetical protein